MEWDKEEHLKQQARQNGTNCSFILWRDTDALPPCYSLMEEIAEYEFLNELQRKAMTRAQKHWQEKTGKHDTWPDLTNLLIFLMNEISPPKEDEG
jgi:hypothetical protein